MGHALNSSYQTRETMEYKRDLGALVLNVSRVVPDGLLVFFPSYAVCAAPRCLPVALFPTASLVLIAYV